MKDAFERRALLLHLGEALQAIAAALAAGSTHRTLRDLLNARTELAAQPWLAALSPDTTTADFVGRASASFAEWPALLLEERVDYARLALAVRDRLFAGDSAGWRRYVDAIRQEVAWFADDLPAAEAHIDETPEPAQAADEAPTPVDANDVERAEEGGSATRESVEGDGRLYPSWPWKPV
jgi:hypothetical protein